MKTILLVLTTLAAGAACASPPADEPSIACVEVAPERGQYLRALLRDTTNVVVRMASAPAWNYEMSGYFLAAEIDVGEDIQTGLWWTGSVADQVQILAVPPSGTALSVTQSTESIRVPVGADNLGAVQALECLGTEPTT